MALTGLAIASALALAKNEMIDKPAAARKRQYEAATAAYSPWTGMQSSFVPDPNALGQVLQYGGAGAAIGSSIHGTNADANLENAAAGKLSTDPQANSLGAMDMSQKLGDQSKNFSTNMAASPAMAPSAAPTGKDPAWFYGASPSKYSQPILGSQFNVDPPNSVWIKNKTDPFSSGY